MLLEQKDDEGSEEKNDGANVGRWEQLLPVGFFHYAIFHGNFYCRIIFSSFIGWLFWKDYIFCWPNLPMVMDNFGKHLPCLPASVHPAKCLANGTLKTTVDWIPCLNILHIWRTLRRAVKTIGRFGRAGAPARRRAKENIMVARSTWRIGLVSYFVVALSNWRHLYVKVL